MHAEYLCPSLQYASLFLRVHQPMPREISRLREHLVALLAGKPLPGFAGAASCGHGTDLLSFLSVPAGFSGRFGRHNLVGSDVTLQVQLLRKLPLANVAGVDFPFRAASRKYKGECAGERREQIRRAVGVYDKIRKPCPAGSRRTTHP